MPLGFVAQAVIGELLGRATGASAAKLKKMLKGDAARKAIEVGLGSAIARYATTEGRLALAEPLFEERGFLSRPEIVGEIAELVRFGREPDSELIGRCWKSAMADPPGWCDYGEEARRLLAFLASELRATETFRPVFDAKTLDELSDGAILSNELLADVYTELRELKESVAAPLGYLARSFGDSPTRNQIIDYTRYIGEWTRDFVGRRFVIEAFDDFMDGASSGYFFLRGDPGIGKTSIAAQMVKSRGYAHHFNGFDGVVYSHQFLGNICAQLIALYQLDYASLPPEAARDGRFLNLLLGQVSSRIGKGENAVVVVDALDEVDSSGMPKGTNTLYLPELPPPGIFFFVTTRRGTQLPQTQAQQMSLEIDQDSSLNRQDIREHLKNAIVSPKIASYISEQDLTDELFIDHMTSKSQGNFMYLHFVLPEIEKGAYLELAIDEIPSGLENYYEDHWNRMKSGGDESWFGYKLPVVAALTLVLEPVSIDLLVEFSHIRSRSRIQAVLDEWDAFLYKKSLSQNGHLERRYRIYHASFHDFLAAKDQVREERVDLKSRERLITNRLLAEFLGDG